MEYQQIPYHDSRNSCVNQMSKFTPHRHHHPQGTINHQPINHGSNIGGHSEESTDPDAYINIEEDSGESSTSTRKFNMAPEIQYWFDQKKKIDQLLLPLPEKRTSSPNITSKNQDKNSKGGKATVKSNFNRIIHSRPNHTQGDPDKTNAKKFADFKNTEGVISAKDLKDAFATFQNKHFSDGVCKFVVRLFDLDLQGGLDIKEFEQLYSYIKLWVSAYHVYDRNHAGFLTEKDFHSALKHMDIHFSPEFISFLVTRCDPIHRRVSLSQFIVTCVQIQKYTDEFKNRDDNYSGTINLRYEDFLEMVLRCL